MPNNLVLLVENVNIITLNCDKIEEDKTGDYLKTNTKNNVNSLRVFINNNI